MKPSFSEKTVLSYISTRKQVTVSEVAEQFGMPAPTVVGILNRLQKKRRVAPGKPLPSRRGRPVITYHLCIAGPTAVFLFDGTQLAGAIFDNDLSVLALETVDDSCVRSLDEASSLLKKCLTNLLTEAGLDGEQSVEVAVVLNGLYLGNRALESTVLPWANNLLVDSFSNSLGMPIRLISSRSLLLAEYQQIVKKPLPQMMVRFSVGDGISANMLMAQQIYEGISLRAGQLGHVVLDPKGPYCGCGRRGCLEGYCSGPAIVKQVLDAMEHGISCSIDYERLKSTPTREAIELIWCAWKGGDKEIRTCMEDVFDQLSRALGLIMNLLDPEMIVFGAYVLSGRPEWLKEIKRRSQQWTFDSSERTTRIDLSQVTIEDQLRAIACCTIDSSDIGLSIETGNMNDIQVFSACESVSA